LVVLQRSDRSFHIMLDGMPEYGVTLSGSLEEPVLENHSGRVVIGYDMKLANANGREMILSAQIMATSGQPGGIPDGGAIYVHGNVPVTLAGQVHVLRPFHSTSLAGPMQSRPVQEFSPGQRPIVNAALVSVIFADGQFVGVDEYGVFESFGRRIKVIVQVGLLAKAGTWDQIESLANALSQSSLRSPSEENPGLYFERRAAALFLVQERKQKGDAAAAQLAEIYSSLPTPWRN
jgi:hypothetical protein